MIPRTVLKRLGVSLWVEPARKFSSRPVSLLLGPSSTLDIQNLSAGKLESRLILLKDADISPEKRGDLVALLRTIPDLEITSKSKICVTAACLLARFVKRCGWDRDENVNECLNSLLKCASEDMHKSSGMLVARSLNASTVASDTAILSDLLKEASRPERLAGYSAMDISEILHACTRIHHALPTEAGALKSLCGGLLSELCEREHYLRIRLQKKDRIDQQWLSIQAVSNVLHSVQRMDLPFPKQFPTVMMRLLAHHCDSEALRSCQILHACNIINSLIRISPECLPSEVLVFKKLIREIIRKKEYIDDAQKISTLFDMIDQRWTGASVEHRQAIQTAKLKLFT